MRHARGFTLLEAIVAMVIFATAAASLYAWQATNMITIDRTQAVSRRDALIRDALAMIETINPMHDPRGERTIGSMRIQWEAQPLTHEVPGVSPVGYPGAFDLRLFSMKVVVWLPKQEPVAFVVRQVGYRETRAAGNGS